MNQQLMDHVGKVIVGKEHTIELVMTAIIASGHVLLEDVPGTGKTMLAKSVAFPHWTAHSNGYSLHRTCCPRT